MEIAFYNEKYLIIQKEIIEEFKEMNDLLKGINKEGIYMLPDISPIELEEAAEAIKEITKELDKKPIVIKVLNIRVDTARDLVFKIYNKTNDIVKSVSLCENLIVYGNRYRTTYESIDESLTEATELFRKGKYKQSMDLSLKAISRIDDTVYSRFGLEE